jgi:hypothetical protein
MADELIHVNQKEEVLKLYPHSTAWKERVKKMSEAQITAIYLEAKSKGRLGK